MSICVVFFTEKIINNKNLVSAKKNLHNYLICLNDVIYKIITIVFVSCKL